MRNVAEEKAEFPAGSQSPEGSWIQITFTLDPGHYRALWRRAEEERRTIPDCVRESVIDFLRETNSASLKRKASAKRNAGDPS